MCTRKVVKKTNFFCDIRAMISVPRDSSARLVATEEGFFQRFPVKDLHLTPLLQTHMQKISIEEIQGMACLRIRNKLVLAEGKNFFKFKSCTNTHKKGVVAFLLESWQ